MNFSFMRFSISIKISRDYLIELNILHGDEISESTIQIETFAFLVKNLIDSLHDVVFYAEW